MSDKLVITSGDLWFTSNGLSSGFKIQHNQCCHRIVNFMNFIMLYMYIFKGVTADQQHYIQNKGKPRSIIRNHFQTTRKRKSDTA